MKINQDFLKAILPTLLELKNKLKGDFVVFGSAPLYLLGILEFKKLNDLDIAIKDEFAIPKEAELVIFANDQRQKLYKLQIGDIKVDIGPAWPGREDIFKRIFQNPTIISGIKFANLGIVQEWKELMVKEYGREKDKEHLEKIRKYKENLTRIDQRV
ncbi:MAG: hypothetical protein Q8N55_02105 [bacterium]|nr:hypothetical protein [bacterium]